MSVSSAARSRLRVITGGGLVPGVTPNIPRAIRNPVKYARADRVPAAVFIFLVLVAFTAWRHGQVPNQKQAIALGIATLVVVVSASVAPDFVTLLLIGVLVAALANNASAVTDIVDRGFAQVGGAFGSGRA